MTHQRHFVAARSFALGAEERLTLGKSLVDLIFEVIQNVIPEKSKIAIENSH
jgi:hypothetical protein